MRVGSLFAGIGGFDLAAQRVGWRTVWHSEIDPFASQVFAARFPESVALGDVTQIAHVEPVDLITAGFPCQDVSVAGKRAGLVGARTGLFWEILRIAELGDVPYLLLENVLGLLSSNGGRDLADILGALVGANVVVPGDGWSGAGVVAGPAGVVTWRVLDAQFFGVPQRRRRWFCLVERYPRTVRGPKILLEPEGVCGDSAPSGEAGEGIARDLAPSVRASGPGFERVGDSRGQDCVVTVAHALTATMAKRHDPDTDTLIAHSLRAEGADASEDGTGRGTPIVAFGWNKSAAQSMAVTEGTTDALCASPTSNPAVIPIQEIGKRTGKSTTDPRAGVGIGESGDPMYSLQAGAQHGVMALQTDVTPKVSELAFTLKQPSKSGGGQPAAVFAAVPRRLTPRECERLQGFPDDWTVVPGRHSKRALRVVADSPRYRALGNGVAVPCVEWIMRRMEGLRC